MGCSHGLRLASRWRAAGDPAVWSRVAPASWRAPPEAPAGWSRRGSRDVCAVRGRDK
ncbi:Piso0_002427 [Millerozyma farinosa CBS 7064]|uniref:Piso0_002427 protein n=1 Tax=Pichia sorbitophila (strain ATCC MYA-4447 / BCRC 22081 / CBS 7064 / NBRC 10061 / NRRL Y-12695) TaxID=559304 RepID=G8YCK8_PICSO|nr:Piso0_002427 [Millerozyma farinosa CBS 7064]